ncbi:MAG: hypothetical protein A2057_05805 [Ignavibacteria bacterium GWA2_35_9]|nr:MAG: hypothetical protein A2057_05805 [Ignavibacteria bacterium GWA2_35_9]OGU46562.1 MAG: hypothetical protein A2000_13620 [Ignavibacteria bacterium GWB2_36_8]OGU52209.1 MAG: hypothetical protein A2080_00745 [Ignavibacteria bacterium GWC2_36_12]
MYKFIFSLIVFLVNLNLFPQEIRLSANKLLYLYDSTFNKIAIYNIGSNPLIIDSMYSKSQSYLGYNIEITLKDTIIFYSLLFDGPPLYFSIEPNDSAVLLFERPYCSICKPNIDFADTLVVHSNAISINYVYIYVEGDGSTDVNDEQILLKDFVLYQNYPNPFNPTTKIDYYIPKTSFVSLIIYDLMGREIKKLIEQEQFSGKHSVIWNGTNEENSKVSSSIYFYKMETAENKIIRKMLLLK